MTYDELMIEAERQGYKLTKINKRTELLRYQAGIFDN